MSLDMTSFAAAIKVHYVDFTVKNMVYKNNALHALMPKYEKFGGLNTPLPLIYGNPQNRSAAFATAIAGTSTTQVKAFTLTRVKDYSVANIDNETIEATEGDSNAFMRAATTEIDGAIYSCQRSLAISEYRNGTGSIGQISASSTVGSTVITLADINSVTNFEVGQVLQLSSGDGSGLRTGSVTLSNVDRIAGTLTASGNWTAGVAAAAAGDFILAAGDFNAKISGLDAWIPMPGVLTSALFFGVDRTVDSTRLAGVSKSFVGVPIEEALIGLSALIGRQGGTTSHDFMSFENYANLEKSLGSKVQYVDLKAADADVGFAGIRVQGTKGPINVVPDQNCQGDRFYALQMDTWKIYSLGMAPRILKSDGLDMLRAATADSVQLRAGYYAQMGCVGPGWNGVGQLA